MNPSIQESPDGPASEVSVYRNDSSAAFFDGATRQVLSDVRTSFDAVKRNARALQNARQASAYATDTYRLADVSYREGYSTNLDLIQAFLVSRDAASQAILAEDALRQSALDLLVAAGRFP